VVKVRFSNRASAGRFSYPSIGESKPSVLERDPCWGKGKAGGLHRVTSRFYYFHQISCFLLWRYLKKAHLSWFILEAIYSTSRLSLSLPFLSIGSRGTGRSLFPPITCFFFRLPSGKVFSCFPPARRRRSVYRLAIHFRPLTRFRSSPSYHIFFLSCFSLLPTFFNL